MPLGGLFPGRVLHRGSLMEAGRNVIHPNAAAPERGSTRSGSARHSRAPELNRPVRTAAARSR